MPIDAEILTELVANLEKYEGRVNHFYLDTVGEVTIGVGHLVKSEADAQNLELFHADATRKLALPEEKAAEYRKVKALQKGMHSSKYKKDTTLMMQDERINILRDEHIASFHRELKNIYTKANGYPAEFDDLPKPVRLALFDMIFNLGATRIVSKFPSFNKALKASDWQEAAKQSNRPQVSKDRNAYVFNKFIEALGSATTPAAPPGPSAPKGAFGPGRGSPVAYA